MGVLVGNRGAERCTVGVGCAGLLECVGWKVKGGRYDVRGKVKGVGRLSGEGVAWLLVDGDVNVGFGVPECREVVGIVDMRVEMQV